MTCWRNGRAMPPYSFGQPRPAEAPSKSGAIPSPAPPGGALPVLRRLAQLGLHKEGVQVGAEVVFLIGPVELHRSRLSQMPTSVASWRKCSAGSPKSAAEDRARRRNR